MENINKYFKKLTDTKVKVPCRISFANIWEPRSINGSEAKYSVSCLVPKENQETIKGIQEAIKNAIEDGKINRWNGKVPQNLKTPIHDGNVDRPDDESYAGHLYFSANSKDAPQIVDRKCNPVTDPMQVYSGCYCLVTVNFYAYNINGSKGVAAGLGNVQFVAAGERLAGRASARDEFEALDEEFMEMPEGDLPDSLS